MIVVYCCTKQMKTFSIDKIMTTESGKFKGTGVDHWKRGKTLRRARRQFTTTGGCAHVHTQHENGARPRLHAASSVKRAKL